MELTEDVFKAIVEANPCGILLVDENRKIIYVNKQAEILFDYTKEELLDQDINILVPPKFVQNHVAKIEQYTHNPKQRVMGPGKLLFGLKKDGTQFPVEVGLSPIDQKGQKMTLCTISDITKLYQTELQMASIMESAPNALILVKKNSEIAQINDTAEKLLGYTKEELKKKKLEVLVPPKLRNFHPSLVSDFMENPKVTLLGSGRELYAHKKDGSVFPVEIGLNPIKFNDETMVLASIIDITERKKQEKILQDHIHKMQLKNQELESLAYSISHDLKEPVRTIISFIKLIGDQYAENLDDRGLKSIQFIQEAGERMNLLINDLLTYSRVGNGSQLSEVESMELVRIVLYDLNELIKTENAKITIDTLPKVIAHKTELRLLIQNLIHNAIKFHKAGVAPVIEIKSSEDEKNWIFHISDNGIGIEKQFYEKIFQIFQRLHNRNQYQGTGIGLAHCHKIIDLHGGKIWVSSTAGEGSTFHFSIPKQHKEQ